MANDDRIKIILGPTIARVIDLDTGLQSSFSIKNESLSKIKEMAISKISRKKFVMLPLMKLRNFSIRKFYTKCYWKFHKTFNTKVYQDRQKLEKYFDTVYLKYWKDDSVGKSE